MRPRALTRYEKYLKVLGIFFDSESATKIDAVRKSETAIFFIGHRQWWEIGWNNQSSGTIYKDLQKTVVEWIDWLRS